MAGGVGSRFWPASRERLPKQFLDILGAGRSLLQLTYDRFSAHCSPDQIYVLTKTDYFSLTREQLPNLPAENIIAEPARRNTAPCIALMNRKVFKKDPGAVLVITPSDHLVIKESEFGLALQDAISFARNQDSLVTLGIRPTRPDTGYGYIEYNQHGNQRVFPVSQFTEKPDKATAEKYVKGGRHVWNAGIFAWRADVAEEGFRQFAPGISSLMDKMDEGLNTPLENSLLTRWYPEAENISIDYAIMEKAGNVYTRPSDIGWSDLGTWNALYGELGHDASGNAVQAGPVILEDVKNCMIRASGQKLVVIRGLSDYIVVDEKDALLIYPKQNEQEIKHVHRRIEDGYGEKFL